MREGWAVAMRSGVLLAFAAAAAIGVVASLDGERRRTAVAEQPGRGTDRGVRVLLANRDPPIPQTTFPEVVLTALQAAEVVTPDDPVEERRLPLPAGARLRVLPDLVDGLILNAPAWGRDVRWPVTRIWLRPQRLERDEAPSLGGRLNLSDPRTVEAADRGPVARLFHAREPRSYRGAIEVRLQDARSLTVINHLPVEAYVAGVVAGEMSPAWPLEALKAQAVVSRSIAVVRARAAARAAPPPAYDLMDGIEDQDYRGAGRHAASVQRAVDETRGVVMTIAGRSLFEPLFCASSGGWTVSSDAVRPGMVDESGRIPLGRTVMRTVADPQSIAGAEALGYAATHGRSTVRLTAKAIRLGLGRTMRARGVEVGALRGLRVSRRDPQSGRALAVVVSQITGDPFELPAHDFRLAVVDDRTGRPLLRSTLWSESSPEKIMNDKQFYDYAFTCLGFGHGAGMSQVGAWWMAQRGAAAAEILAHYYGGTQLVLRAAW